MTEKSQDVFEKITPALLVLTVVLAFVVGILWQKVSNLEGGNVGSLADEQVVAPEEFDGKLDGEQAEKVVKVKDSDHVRGSRDAEVFLIEYSDFECPYCASFHPTASQALDEYDGKVAWVYRHFPLDSIHPRARPAAAASECVASLAGNDAFWVFADELFGNQATALSDGGLKEAAVKAGVDGASFDSCIADERFVDKVESDYQEGLTAGVTGTPGNFVMNGDGEVWVIPGAVEIDTLKSTIDDALGS